MAADYDGVKPGVNNVLVITGEVQKKEGVNCACKEYYLIWGGHKNVLCDFRKKVVEISKRQNFDPNHLMAVMWVESAHTFSPSKTVFSVVGHSKNGKEIYGYSILSKD